MDELKPAGRVLAPLGVWTAHFAFCYGWAIVACTPRSAAWSVAGASLASVGFGVATAVAVAVVLAMNVGALRQRARGATDRGLAADARLGASLLALVATLWAAVPMLMLPSCR